MKFTIQKDLLLESIQNVMKAISSRVTIPILTGIKIEATNDGVKLTGSNSDISIESFIPTENDGIINIENIRSEEHTSELQSRGHLVCRLLLEKKNNII